MQLVDPPHDGKIGRRHRPWHIINTAAADPQCLRLLRNRQRVDTVDHRFVLGNSPALPSAPDKKSFTNVNAPILACNVFTSITSPAGRLENTGAAFQQLRSPGRDLVRVNVKLLRQLRERLLTLHGSQSHHRLECRTVVPARSFRRLISCSAALLAAISQKLHLTQRPVLPSSTEPRLQSVRAKTRLHL